MSSHAPPRLPLALLERLVPDSEPLAGDLIEDFERHQSYAWFWWQALGAIVHARLSFERPVEIRPLRLVDLQPADALERSRRMITRFRAVNLSASPLSGVGGLGLAALALLVTIVAPGVWWLLLGSSFAGAVTGIVLIVVRTRPPSADKDLAISLDPGALPRAPATTPAEDARALPPSG